MKTFDRQSDMFLADGTYERQPCFVQRRSGIRT
jgi:hypothetical protein